MNLKEQIQQKIDYRSFYTLHLGTLPKPNDQAEVSVICPFHVDKDPSLSINLKTGLYHCFGCGAKGDVFKFYQEKENIPFAIAIKRMADDLHISKAKSGDLGELQKTYDYKDAEGKSIFQVCRFEGKQIRLRQPDGHGGWVWNMKGVEAVPYNLPSIIKSSTVYVCEGEKDADNLIDLGFCATTNSNGAGKWKPSFQEYFEGKKVVILPDNDEPGKAHAEDVANNLAGVASSVKIINLEGLKKKGDVTDWLHSLSTPSKTRARMCLALRVVCAAVWIPGEEVETEKDNSILTILESSIITSTDFLNEKIPVPRTIIDPWLVDGSISMLFAKRGVGKTWLSLIIAMMITRENAVNNTAYNIGPWQCTNTAGVLYVDGEMGQFDLQDRLRRLQANMGKEGKDTPLSILSSNRIAATHDTQTNITNPFWRDGIYSYLKTHNEYKLIVLDNIASLSPGIDENAKQEWDAINQWLLGIKAMGKAVILVHHAGKEGKQRGTSGREDNLDCVIKLKNPAGYNITDGAFFNIEFEKARNMGPKANLNSFTLKITEDKQGGIIWTKDKQLEEKELLLALILDGRIKGKKLTDLIGCSKMWVSKATQKAVVDGMLDESKRITPKGVKALNLLKTKHNLEEYYG